MVNALLAALFLLAAQSHTTTIFQGRPVTVAAPEGWTYAESRDKETGVQTLELADPSGEVKVALSFFPDEENRLGSKAAIESFMRKAFAGMLETAVEREMKIVSSEVAGGFEGHTVLTDKKYVGRDVPKEQRRLATVGIRSWPGAFGLFTVLSNESESAAYKSALELIRSGVKVGEATAAEDDRLTVVERPEVFEVSVPVSNLVMRIPKSGMSQKKSDDNGKRYFYFQNAGFIVSGWFEAQEEFTGVKQIWETDIAAWKQKNVPPPKNVSFRKIGKWDAVVYQIGIPTGTNSHIRAHWVEAGTWIDLHLSLTSDGSDADNIARLESLLNRIEVVKK